MNGYKFVKVSSFYRQFLKDYYSLHPEEKTKPYAEQLSGLMKQAVGWSDFFAVRLHQLGVDASEIVFNAMPLQLKWAEENNCPLTGKGIVLEQLARLKPDVVMFQDSISFNGEWISLLKEKVPSVKLAIGWCCSPIPERLLSEFRAFDFSFVCSPKFRQDFENAGLRVYQFYHAFEDSLLPLLETGNTFPDTDFLFSGSIIPGGGFHDIRLSVLEELIRAGIDISIYANIPVLTARDLWMRRSMYIAAKSFSAMGLEKLASKLPGLGKALYLESMPSNIDSVITKIAKPPLFGLDMLRALNKSKTVFNNHGEVAGDYAANIRMFEVTGAGSCLVTDHKNNINELFEPDKEIVTYSSTAECIEKVKWLVDHPAERREIAAAGQKRTLSSHTIKHRAGYLHEVVSGELSSEL
ncbi:MAG: glycosyltransferase [Bacteroidota bacterium]